MDAAGSFSGKKSGLADTAVAKSRAPAARSAKDRYGCRSEARIFWRSVSSG
jgi:hypothetical protein